jgi:hypothetical protein
MENFDSGGISEEDVTDQLQKQISSPVSPREEFKEDNQYFRGKRSQLERGMPLSKHIPKDIMNSTDLGASKNLLCANGFIS